MKTLRNLLIITAALVLTMSARANAILEITDGSTTVSVNDSDSDGVVSWAGVIGVWDLNFDNGVTKPQVGSVTNPVMDLHFFASSTGAGTLTIKFSDWGFNAVGGLLDSIGGTTTGSVIDNIYINGLPLVTTGWLLGPSYSKDVSAGVALTPSDMLTLEVKISHGQSGGITSGDKYVTVPDGGMTALMVGLGLVGMAVAARRRQK